MKFIVPFLGKTREKYLDAAIQDYAGRLGRYVTVDIPVLKTGSPKNIPEEVYRRQESELLLARIRPPSLVVALDTVGREVNSEELADLLEEWENRGVQTVHFLIGGHLGLHDDVLNRAELALSLSRLTFTHEMSRFLLLEQLYRAWTIKAGHNYHN